MLSSEALAITFGFSSALSWGAGDFSGGFATKHNGVLRVILYSQIIGTLLLVGLLMVLGEPLPETAYLGWGALAGAGGAIGLVALYKGLALGRMGIVAPLSAICTALAAMLLGIFLEGLPKSTQLLGFGAAMIAVWLLSAAGGPHQRVTRRELTHSLWAGLGFGLFFGCIDRFSSEAILWPLVAARLNSMVIIALLLAVKGQLTLAGHHRLGFIALAGILDTVGNAFFALASQLGRLDVAAMVASLYPVSTVVLARCFLKERISRQQWAGLLTALSALILIAT
jgi:uncharacterized membrane protein